MDGSLEIRPGAVAGLFYPKAPDALARSVDACITSARVRHPAPKAIIAPHAGYVYSGPIAGTAYATLGDAAERISRVVLLGPNHRVPVRGFALSSARAFRTPLGVVPVDWSTVERLRRLPEVEISDHAHGEEHSLEVHLPFLQWVLGEFACVPILVGTVSPEAVDRLLRELWGGPETLIVVSSDLSHYHDYETARGLDRDASRAIETLRPDLLREEQACGRHAIRGLLLRARALDLRATTLDLRNSGNTAGPKDRVVGYGSYVFEYGRGARLSDRQRTTLIDAARRTIRHGRIAGKPPDVTLGTFEPQLENTRASFVTLMRNGTLRGCVGSVNACQPLVLDVVQSAYKAAYGDPRFPPLNAEEVETVDISISILGTPQPLPVSGEAALIAALRPDEDGLILRQGERRGVFLPQVWKQLPDPAAFVAQLKRKAGLPAETWADTIEACRFSVESFSGA